METKLQTAAMLSLKTPFCPKTIFVILVLVLQATVLVFVFVLR